MSEIIRCLFASHAKIGAETDSRYKKISNIIILFTEKDREYIIRRIMNYRAKNMVATALRMVKIQNFFILKFFWQRIFSPLSKKCKDLLTISVALKLLHSIASGKYRTIFAFIACTHVYSLWLEITWYYLNVLSRKIYLRICTAKKCAI